MKNAIRRAFLPLVAAALAGCSDDAELADPGGMGAGRPDTAGASAEVPAESVLQYGTPDALSDTSAAVTGPGGARSDSALPR